MTRAIDRIRRGIENGLVLVMALVLFALANSAGEPLGKLLYFFTH